MHILYLVPHVPHPTKIRSHFQVRGLLNAGHRVTVVTLERSAGDRQAIAQLEGSGAKVIRAKLSRQQSLLNSASVLPSRQPLQSAFMWSDELMGQITAAVQADPPDVIHVEHLRMARYGLKLVKDWPTVWDAVDSLSTLYQQAAVTSASLPLRVVSRLEAPRLATYERWLTGQFPVTTVISERDRVLFQENNPYADRVKTVLMGLPVEPLKSAVRTPATLILTGTLNYHPNVASVNYFIRDIFPLITRQRADVHLQLVGSKPSAAILALQSPQIEVTGFVPSVTDYLQQATVALAPIVYGSGMQIKVLEAFLTATPLVATRVALRGLDVQDGEQVLIADTPEDFGRAVIRLLDDADLRARIGQAGRRYIEQNHDLVKTTARLVSIYEAVIAEKGRHSG